MSVTAFLIVQHADHPRLSSTIEAVVNSTRQPDRVVIVDGTPERDLPTRLHEIPEFAGRFADLSVVTVPPGAPFAEIVDTAVSALPAPGDDAVVALRSRGRARKRAVHPTDRDQWLWLLHEDTAPAADALEQLALVVERSDRIGIAGCKVVDSDDERHLVNVGLELTRTGRFPGLRANLEPDQGQYDARRDVLGVSSAGMLVRRDAWATLGGFDPAFDGDGDGLDLCWRAHLTGRQVIVVPSARVQQRSNDATGERDQPTPDAPLSLRRNRQVALARCSLVGLPFMALWVLISCLFFGLVALLMKRPRRALAEFAQATAPLGITRIVGARARFFGRASTRRRNLRGLFIPWRSALRDSWDALVHDLGRAPGAATVAPFTDDDPADRHRTPLWRHPALWLTIVLLAAAAVQWRHLLTSGALRGTGVGLTGGQLQPFATDAGGVWRMWREAWTGPGLGGGNHPAPYLVVLAPLAWVVQQVPGVNGSASAATVVAWLLLLAMPLSGIAAYRAGRVATRAAWPRFAAALAWASLPTLTTAIGAGRLGPVVGHILFPLVFAGVLAIGRRHASTSLTAATAIAAAVMGAFAPVLLVVATLVAVVLLVIGPGWARMRGLSVAVLPWLLLWPWTWALRNDWRAVLAGPGGLDVVRGTQPWQFALLHPGGPASYLTWVSVPVLVVGVLGLVRRGFAKASSALVVLGLVGLAAALGAGHLRLAGWPEGARTPWAGYGIDLFAAALLGSALLSVRGSVRADHTSRPGMPKNLLTSAVAAACAVFAAVLGVAVWTAAPTGLRAASAPYPGLVADQVSGPDAMRALRLTVSSRDAVTYQLLGRESGLPNPGLTAPASSGGTLTAIAVTGLLHPGSGTSATVRRQLLDVAVGFVVVDGPGSHAAINAALQQLAGLTQVSANPDQSVWRLDPSVAAGGAVLGAPSRVFVEQGRQSVLALPSIADHARSTTSVPAGPSGRTLVVSEGTGWRHDGVVRFDGVALTAQVTGGVLTYPLPPQAGMITADPGLAHPIADLADGVLAALLIFLAVPFGRRRVDGVA
ncbi:GT2 family glycosyltransferase [Rudaeicoccus suwonensis]|uniref:GT2 family glycosyltransferase n=1 Tax=Rudaeicoccus suwonensis TaxID=657409 RepID=A0A561E952_9MICO|nr:GT2 family glycosyltransferase [Rudaeicoccus suwonensis]